MYNEMIIEAADCIQNGGSWFGTIYQIANDFGYDVSIFGSDVQDELDNRENARNSVAYC